MLGFALVEYLVLARGGERVAEVAARFVLDALPGRQAAIEADLRRAVAAAVALAEAGRDMPMAGRTLGMQAAPITFGFKAASWALGLVRAGRNLVRVTADVPAVQLGGAT